MPPLERLPPWQRRWMGLIWTGVILGLWTVSLVVGLRVQIDWTQPLFYLWFLVQTHLYTGIFITAHDAMHNSLSPWKRVNTFMGWLCATLFAFNYYPALLRNHHRHHRHVATDNDPDVHPNHGFWGWYLRFLRSYLTVPQFILMAITFNVLRLYVPVPNLIFFWMAPAVLSTLQLFYFGTWLPHRAPPDNVHRSRSQAPNHLWAFLSCYFFGYHYEHHAHPWVPWWALPLYRSRS